MNMSRVEGKVALVTGGARGQGACHGDLLAREGARVVLADVLDDAGHRVADTLAREGLEVCYTHLDVSREEDWQRAIEFTEAQFGPITVLVNNAGIHGGDGPSGIMECSLEDWNRVIAVNQTGVFLGIRAVTPGMRASGGGSIINIASLWGHSGGAPDLVAAYVASKAAVLGLTRNAAISLAPDGIRVNSISPGVVLVTAGEPDGVDRDLIERAPMKRGGKPSEIAYLVVYLASDEASFTTGADHLVDGGVQAM